MAEAMAIEDTKHDDENANSINVSISFVSNLVFISFAKNEMSYLCEFFPRIIGFRLDIVT